MGNDETGLPGVGAPALRALAGAGYTRLAQFTKVTESELPELYGVGPKAVGILRDALTELSLSFRAE